VQTLDMTTSPPTPGPAVGVCTSAGSTQCAASIATVDGSTMYLAGSYLNPSATDPCPTQTAFTPTCGLLTVFDLNTMTPLVSGISITDGFHNHIALGANGQLFAGARTCTETTDVSGCLSIYNSTGKAVGKVPPGGVLIPPANGDVTGIEPVGKRTVVYVVQGATVTVYDTTTDALAIIKTNPNNPGHINNLIGNFVDVKIVDF
jgi:hypothetical protein